jgi:CubicO group peptidase (beta-lactamase class C family)
MFLNKGSYGGVQILPPNSVSKLTKNQTPEVTAAATDVSPLNNLLLTPKGFGWELATRRFSTAGMRLSAGSYGKMGGAGTFMWVDPHRKLFGILLTNHGLPTPFDEINWNRMLDAIDPAEFFDGVVNAVDDDC